MKSEIFVNVRIVNFIAKTSRTFMWNLHCVKSIQVRTRNNSAFGNFSNSAHILSRLHFLSLDFIACCRPQLFVEASVCINRFSIGFASTILILFFKCDSRQFDLNKKNLPGKMQFDVCGGSSSLILLIVLI